MFYCKWKIADISVPRVTGGKCTQQAELSGENINITYKPDGTHVAVGNRVLSRSSCLCTCIVPTWTVYALLDRSLYQWLFFFYWPM